MFQHRNINYKEPTAIPEVEKWTRGPITRFKITGKMINKLGNE